MIRAAIGRFILRCIDAEKRRKYKFETRRIDFAKLTQSQISDLLHGRAIDLDNMELIRGVRR